MVEKDRELTLAEKLEQVEKIRERDSRHTDAPAHYQALHERRLLVSVIDELLAPSTNPDNLPAGSPQLYTWWVSWWHDYKKDGEFEIQGPCWLTGYSVDDAKRSFVCALRARDEDHAREIVRNAYDTPPDSLDERFCDLVMDEGGSITPDAPWTGPGGRFPRPDWAVWPWPMES